MYCRNCGNDVNDKAVACPKCGVNPRSEKKFCPSCGVATNENQILCTQCGVSLKNEAFSLDMSGLQTFDVNSFISNKPAIAALVAVIGCFLPWIKVNAFFMAMSLNFFQMSKLSDIAPDSILVSFLLYLFVLVLIAFIAADYVPQIKQYKKIFSLASLGLLIYIVVGLWMASHPSTPDMGDNEMAGMMGEMAQKAQEAASNMVSLGIGFYITVIATIASFVLYKRAN